MSGKTSKLAQSRRQATGLFGLGGPVPYTLMEGPKLSASDDGASATEVYHMRASDVETFFSISFPPPVISQGISWLPPRRRMPGTGILITKSIDAEPLSGDKPGDPLGVDTDLTSEAHRATYNDTYKVTINYETAQENDNNERDPNDPETFLEVSMTGGGQFLSIPPQKTTVSQKDVNGNAEEASNASGQPGGTPEANRDQQLPLLKIIPTVDWQLKWKHAINPNWTRIFGDLGRVNSDSIALFKDPDKETLLYMGFSASQSWLWNGASASAQPWTLDLKYSQRIINEGTFTYGWNHVYSPQKNRWVYPTRADGNPMYQSMSLNTFFS